ncbi:prephenate dehydratase domain-containing protein [Amycolatopsis tolypomycina]|nr:prephenate dehydratase domain-containing protein [Amycolatopsis tolypomycina]
MSVAEPMLLAEPRLAVLSGSDVPVKAVGTLGPAGTSSEQAARHVWRTFAADGPPEIRLFDTYEKAAEALRSGEVSHVVVASAYSGVNDYYMDTRLALCGAFIQDTPLYGLARRRDRKALPDWPRIATHPAPTALIAQLLPERFTGYEAIKVTSTSAAAIAVGDGVVDLALTTQPAVAAHDLEFISRTRTIRMLWSVFVAARV